jgi:RNA polymerase sigma-70 factor (ECF subfamily)
MSPDTTEGERLIALLRKAEGCDPQAAHALVLALLPIVRGTVALAMRRRSRALRAVDQEVEDMVQSVLFSLFVKDGGRAILSWDPARGRTLASFAALLARREVATILRSRRRNPWTEEPVLAEALDQRRDASVGPETLTGSRRLLLAVAARLREDLSARGYRLFELLYLEDHTPEEVSAIAGLELPAVYAWRSRLSQRVRAIVAELDRGAPRADDSHAA